MFEPAKSCPRTLSFSCCIFFVAIGTLVTQTTAEGSVIAINPGTFPGGSALLNFTGLAEGTEVNGLSVGGALFTYSLGNGNIIIIVDGGPGATNNISPPNVLSIGDNTGILTVALPSPATMFGYGYALLNFVPITAATTITLFSGATNVGSLSYDALLDPDFPGGFAGIQSTIPFDSVQIGFNSVDAPAFAFDNIRFDSVVTPGIPEPSSVTLIALGLTALMFRRLRRATSK